MGDTVRYTYLLLMLLVAACTSTGTVRPCNRHLEPINVPSREASP
jgi:hypothetical protein